MEQPQATAYLYDGNGRRCARLSDDDQDGTLETALILVGAGSRVVEEVTAGPVAFTPEDLGNVNSSRDTTTALTAATASTPGLRVREYIYAEMGVDDRIVFRRDADGNGTIDEAYNYLTDQIGTVFALANGVGGIAEAYDYDAYGAPYRLLPGLDGMLFTTDDVRQAPSPVAALSLFDNPYAFQGRRWEPSSGYYDFRARFYDAEVGTWLTRDPAGFVNGSNLYQFVGSLPWTLDPFGLCGRERSMLEHMRDGAAGFIDGAISGVTFGLVETTIGADMLGADTSSAAYMAGNIAGNMVGGMAAGVVTGPAGSCSAMGRLFNAGAKVMRAAEKFAEIKDGIQTAVDLVNAIRCGDPWAIAGAAFGAAMTAAPHLGSAMGKKIDPSPCGRNCFVAGTPVWVLKDDCDPNEANAALAAAESKAKASGDRLILQREIDKWATTKPIEAVTADDHALSRDESGPENPLVFSPVVQTFQNVTETVIWLTIRDTATGETETIGTTPGHPFWVESTNGDLVPEADVSDTHLAGLPARHRTTRGDLARITRGWVHTADLRAGYVLIGNDGKQVVVVNVRAEQARRETFNFHVTRDHTYYAGGTSVWCHNSSSTGGCFGSINPHSVADVDAAITQIGVESLRDAKALARSGGAAHAGEAWRTSENLFNQRLSALDAHLDASGSSLRIQTQVSFSGGFEVPHGTKGSVRPDAILRENGQVVSAYDISFADVERNAGKGKPLVIPDVEQNIPGAAIRDIRASGHLDRSDAARITRYPEW